jgi:signal transduction histidine kinase
MDILLRDERVRVVLHQLPRFLSTAIPLSDKLDELCETARDVLRVDGAALVLLAETTPEVTHAGDLDPSVVEALGEPARIRETVAASTVSPRVDARSTGLLVPLRNGTDIYGALYVGRAGTAPFTGDDESLLLLFTEAVGPAVAHGVRMLSTERAERWSAAAVRLTEQFLAEEADDPYATVVDVVYDLGEADVVGIVVTGPDLVRVERVRGMGLERLGGTVVPPATDYGQDIIRHGRGVIANDVARDSAFAAEHMPDVRLGPLMAVPLKGAKGPLGVLFIARREGAPVFRQDDLRIAERFAVNAAVSMEWHAARRTHDELRMLQERNRIARDLHDNVVQRLFATGLYLQQASRTLEGEAKDRVEGAMTAIDQTIRQIRNTILVLRSTAADRLDSLLTAIVAETTPLLGFPPRIAVAPGVSRVTGPLAADLALCVREALSNVVQHARATAVELEVGVEDETVVLRISDNGVGLQGPPRPGGGLENLDERARAHGGTFTYCSDPGEGTTLRWRMPLPPPV